MLLRPIVVFPFIATWDFNSVPSPIEMFPYILQKGPILTLSPNFTDLPIMLLW